MIRTIIAVVLAVVITLALSASAYAAATERCGNGIDDSLATGGSAAGTYGACPAGFVNTIRGPNGCDRQCPEDDKDRDGYPSDEDPDDNNRDIFPGEYYFCDPAGAPTNGYRLANSDGTYGTCIDSDTTPLCEATGSGVCKYINCNGAVGSDSNPGTYASPYLTFGKIAGGSSGSPPASPYSLNPGDVVYLVGTTNCTTTYAISGQQYHAQLTRPGTADNKITIKRYPGSTAVFDLSNDYGFEVTDGDNFYVFDDLWFTGSCTTSNIINNAPIIIRGDDWEVRRMYCYDWTGSSYNNDSCVYAPGTNRGYYHHSFAKDWGQGSSGCNNPGSGQNVTAIKLLDDEDTGNGADHRIKYNVFWQSTPETDFATEGGCIFYKHGIDAQDAGTNGTIVESNYCINSSVFLQWTSSKLRARYNVTDNVWKTYYSVEGGGTGTSAPMEDNLIERNSFFDSGDVGWGKPAFTSTAQKLTVQDNIFTDERSFYESGNSEGIYSIYGYGTDAEKTTFESYNGGTGSLFANRNCFYNPNTAVNFCYFCQNQAAAGDEAGANYTFAQLQSVLSQDPNSYNRNPVLDVYGRSTDSLCLDKGYLLLSEEPPAPPPSTVYYGGPAKWGRWRRSRY